MHIDEIYSDAAATPETGKTFLRHALRVWARENGVADEQLPGVVHNILDFALGSLREGARPQGFSA